MSTERAPESLAPQAPTPTAPLFSLKAIGMGAFVLSPLGGAIMMSLNEHRLGRARSVWGIVAVASLLSFVELLVYQETSNVVGGIVAGVVALLWHAHAKSRQGRDIERLRDAGGRLEGIGSILGWGVLGWVGSIALAWGTFSLLGDHPSGYATYVPAPGTNVYYDTDVSEVEAREIGDALTLVDFRLPRGLDVVLQRHEREIDVCVVVKDDAIDDLQVRAAFRTLVRLLDEAVPERHLSGSVCDVRSKRRAVFYP